MLLLYTAFFAAGAAAIAYATFGRHIGYGNSQAVWVFLSVIFFIAFFVFYTGAHFFLPG
jgi:hypothetical protein